MSSNKVKTYTYVPIEEQNRISREFRNWLKIAKVGERYCYFTGDYLHNNLVAREVRDAYDSWKVVLFKKREGTNLFSYWAQRRDNE